MAAGAHFGCQKFTFDRISGHFRSIRNFIFFWIFWQNGCRRPFWMSEIHFRSHFWPFQIDQPFWISEIHFRLQFWPFQIDTDFVCVHFESPKITLDRISGHFRSIGHFGCLKFTFDRISGHFRSIRNFNFLDFLDKMADVGHFGCGWFVADENIIFPKTYVSREYNKLRVEYTNVYQRILGYSCIIYSVSNMFATNRLDDFDTLIRTKCAHFSK